MPKTAKPAKPASSATDADFPLLARIDELVDGLRGYVPAALKEFDEDGIHQARVSTRRLKAALDLLAPVLSKRNRRPFDRVLKKLRRRLGPLRDLDVMIGHLGDWAKNPKHAPAAYWLKEQLARRRDAEREPAGAKKSAVTKTLGRLGTWWGLREEVLEAKEAVGSLLAESLHLQLDAFAEQADRVACKDRAAGDGAEAPTAEAVVWADVTPATAEVAAGTPSPESIAEPPAADGAPAHLDPHELRIAGKALRYTLEMAAVEGHKLPPGVGKAFKAMQEALGLWHDYVVLTETAMRTMLDALLPHHNAALSAGVLELTRAALARSAKELAKFSALWLDRGEELARTIRAAFPLTRSLQQAAAAPDGTTAAAAGSAVTAPQTGPGPCGSAAPEAPGATPPGEPSAA